MSRIIDKSLVFLTHMGYIDTVITENKHDFINVHCLLWDALLCCTTCHQISINLKQNLKMGTVQLQCLQSAQKPKINGRLLSCSIP